MINWSSVRYALTKSGKEVLASFYFVLMLIVFLFLAFVPGGIILGHGFMWIFPDVFPHLEGFMDYTLLGVIFMLLLYFVFSFLSAFVFNPIRFFVSSYREHEQINGGK